jgi:hypothetical protein
VGIVGGGERARGAPSLSLITPVPADAELLRPLSEYESALGGSW